MTIDLEAIKSKLDRVHIFEPEELNDIEESIKFYKAFSGNPKTLLKMQDMYESVEGFVKITKIIGLLIAFIVILWTNWERLTDLIRGGVVK